MAIPQQIENNLVNTRMDTSQSAAGLSQSRNDTSACEVSQSKMMETHGERLNTQSVAETQALETPRVHNQSVAENQA